MLSLLLSILPWTGLAAIFAAALAFRWGVVQRDEAAFWRARTAEAKAGQAQAQAMVDALRADIAAWKRKADEQAEVVAGAQLAASIAVRRYDELRNQIDATPPPADPGGAIDWLARAAKEIADGSKNPPAPPDGRAS